MARNNYDRYVRFYTFGSTAVKVVDPRLKKAVSQILFCKIVYCIKDLQCRGSGEKQSIFQSFHGKTFGILFDFKENLNNLPWCFFTGKAGFHQPFKFIGSQLQLRIIG